MAAALPIAATMSLTPRGDEEPTEAEEPEGDKHELTEFFAHWEGKSGVYFISPYFVPQRPNAAYAVKIGMSKHRSIPRPRGGLGRRLDSYYLCFPYGYYVYAVLQCDRKDAFTVEKKFHQYFTGKGFKSEQQHSHSEEWFLLTHRDVLTTIDMFQKAYPGCVKSAEIYEMPLFVDASGKLAAHPKKDMSLTEKAYLESFASDETIPATLPRKKHKQQKEDEQQQRKALDLLEEF